jgi:hypothetical protein
MFCEGALFHNGHFMISLIQLQMPLTTKNAIKDGSKSTTNGINDYSNNKRLVIKCHFWHSDVIQFEDFGV